jgi:hypothetical protein
VLSSTGSAATCGKRVQIIQSSGVKLNEWVKHIIKELGDCLMIAGLRTKSQHTSLFFTKTLALVALAYDLRTAMAEKDICGGLEVVIVAPDTPFQEKWMMDGHADVREGDTDQSCVDSVAGTIGLGLQRNVSDNLDGQFQSRMNMELKPKVILARALNVKQIDRNVSESQLGSNIIVRKILQAILALVDFILDILTKLAKM